MIECVNEYIMVVCGLARVGIGHVRWFKASSAPFSFKPGRLSCRSS